MKGANILDTTVPYTGSLDYMSSSTAVLPLDSLSQDYLTEILQICKDNNITLLMVTSPSALNWTEGKHKTVDAWCTQHQITYIDYNEKDEIQKISIDWSTDTRDGGDHLNLSGSKKITSDIGKYLSKNFSLTDHRNEEKYAEWAKTYAGSKLYHEGKK